VVTVVEMLVVALKVVVLIVLAATTVYEYPLHAVLL